jgi:Kef-type K+ transport system membrane component KefB
MFLAGLELDLARIRGRSLRLAVTGWLVSLALALLIASALARMRLGISRPAMSRPALPP